MAAAFGQVLRVDLATGRTETLTPDLDELDPPVRVAFAKGGALAAAAGFEEQELRLWDAGTWKRIRTVPLGAKVRALDIAGDRLALAVGGRVELRQLPDGRRIHQIPMPYGLEAMHAVLDAAGRRLAHCSAAGHLQVYDVQQGMSLGQRQIAEAPVTRVRLSPRGDRVAYGLGNGRLRLASARGLKAIRSFRSPALGAAITGLRFVAQGSRLLAVRQDGELLELDATTGAVLSRLQPPGGVSGIGASADGAAIAGLAPRGHLRVWAAAGRGSATDPPLPPPAPRPRPTLALAAPTAAPPLPAKTDITSLALHRDGRQVVVAHGVTALEGYRLLTRPKPRWVRAWRRPLPRPRSKTTRGVRLALGPRGQWVYSHGPTDQLRRFRWLGGWPAAMLPTRARGLRSLLPTPDGRLLVTTAAGAKVHLWAPNGLPRGTFAGLPNPYWVAISPDSKRLAEVAGVDDIGVFTLPAGKHIWTRQNRRHRRREVLAIRFSPDSKQLVTYHRTGFLRVHDAATGRIERQRHLPVPAGTYGCDLRPDLRVLACATRTVLHLFDVRSAVPLRSIELPARTGADHIRALFYASDGQALVVQAGPRLVDVYHFSR